MTPSNNPVYEGMQEQATKHSNNKASECYFGVGSDDISGEYEIVNTIS